MKQHLGQASNHSMTLEKHDSCSVSGTLGGVTGLWIWRSSRGGEKDRKEGSGDAGSTDSFGLVLAERGLFPFLKSLITTY